MGAKAHLNIGRRPSALGPYPRLSHGSSCCNGPFGPKRRLVF